MSEKNVDELLKECSAVFKAGTDRAWSLELTEDTPQCRCALRDIYENLGPESKKFLAKRLVVHDPELKKIVDES